MRERLVELIRTGMSKHEVTIENYVIPTSDYLADYLIANGVIVPPSKVGETVYSIKGCFRLPFATKIRFKELIPCEVIAIKETKRSKYILLKPLLIETFGMRSANKWFGFSAIGKTVFLTKEEAISKLQASCEQVKGGVES